jgi:hypothetical protein
VGIGVTSTDTTALNGFSSTGSMDSLPWFKAVLPAETTASGLYSGTLKCEAFCPAGTYVKVYVSCSVPNATSGVRTYSWSPSVNFLSGYLVSGI